MRDPETSGGSAGAGHRDLQGREVAGVVRLVEPTGGQTWVTVELSGPGRTETLVGLADSAYRGRPGLRAMISAAGAACHLFDPGTGRRIDAEVSIAAGAEERRTAP